jgi:hypothetical protein
MPNKSFNIVINQFAFDVATVTGRVLLYSTALSLMAFQSAPGQAASGVMMNETSSSAEYPISDCSAARKLKKDSGR